MPVTDRAAQSEGLFASETSWDELDPPSIGGAHLAAGTYLLWSVPPLNEAFLRDGSKDNFKGTALAAATTSKAAGVLNYPVATMFGAWVFLSAAGNTSTFQFQLVSGSSTSTTVVSTNLNSATATSTLVVGWNLITLTIPTERQPTFPGGVLQPQCMLLFPGDNIQVAVAVATSTANFAVDIA